MILRLFWHDGRQDVVMELREYKGNIARLKLAQLAWDLDGRPGGAAAGLRFIETATALAIATVKPIADRNPKARLSDEACAWLRQP